MEIQQAVRERLVGADAVYALAADRVRPLQLAQDDPMPFVVYERTSREPVRTLEGDDLSSGSVGIRLSCYALSYDAAGQLARACLAALLDPTWTHSVDYTRLIKGVFFDDDSDGSEIPIHGEEAGPYYATVDVTIHYA